MPSLDPDRRTDRAITLAEVGRLIGRPDLFAGDTRTITHATDDSRRVGPGGLFVATDGNRLDGADFAAEAVARGAAAVISHKAIEVDAPTAFVDDPRPVASLVEAAIAGRPDDRVRVAAVTGTDGKTTTTWLTRHLLGTVGRRCGLVGTIETDDGTATRPAVLTTPKAETFWPLLGRMDAAGVRHAAVECSSQALDQRRLAGLRIDAAVVTNLTADHLDYHGSVDAYAAAKARLFEGLRPGGWAVLNADDPRCDRFAAAVPAGRAVLRFGFGEDADLAARDVRIDGDGTSFTLAFGRDRRAVRLSLPGRHNVANALAALAVAARFGLNLDEIAAGLETAVAPPGRLERVATEPCDVFVDYAHTPAALSHAVATLREHLDGRLIVVCGAGGDRDPSKRPGLGQAASAADLVVVTSDNPRTESPEAIIRDVAAGIGGGVEILTLVDRAAAIDAALAAARPGDRVLVAGKGHERFQDVDTRRVPFDDRVVAAELADRYRTNAVSRPTEAAVPV